MKKTSLIEITAAVKGQLWQGDGGPEIERVCTDSRRLQRGDLFIALKGERFDGHHYALAAVQGGAGALMLSRELPNIPSHVPVILVQDTLRALQALASFNRRRYNIPVIGVTGSNGKTTTKDLIAAVLSTKFKTLKTEGNFNNEIGLPLTLLQLNDHQGAVVEMGMRGLGQIDELCQIAGITGAVITNIGETHLELLGTRENIARAKGEILEHVPKQGFALLPADNPLATAQAHRCRGKVLTFGIECAGDFVATNLRIDAEGSYFTAVTPQGRWEVALPIPGRHNVANALAALAVGVQLGLSMEQILGGLQTAQVSGMRLELINKGEITIINDAYNANPESTQAALRTLTDLAQGRRRVAVLGSMFELGSREQQGHYETGVVAAHNVQLLVTVGELAKNIAAGAKEAGLPADHVQWFADNKAAVAYLKENLQAGDMVLIKGSRGMHMEEIVDAL